MRWATSMPLVALLASLVGGACASSGGAGASATRRPLPLIGRLSAAATEQAELPVKKIRYNPTPKTCACPPFEILVGDAWWRVHLEPVSEEIPAEIALAKREGDRLRVLYAVGVLDDDPIVLCANGRYGFEMILESVSSTPPTLPPEP